MTRLDAETRQRIEEGLREWHHADSEVRKRYEAAKRKFDKQRQRVTDALEGSERLTAEDLTFRVGEVLP